MTSLLFDIGVDDPEGQILSKSGLGAGNRIRTRKLKLIFFSKAHLHAGWAFELSEGKLHRHTQKLHVWRR